MALTSKTTGLVPGVPLDPTPLVTVKVVKGFYDHEGQVRAPGVIVQLPERFARGVIANGKAERVPDAPRVSVTVDPEPDESPKAEAPLPPAWEVPRDVPPKPKKKSRFERGNK